MPDLATLAILALAGAVQGFLGFGFGIVAMSALTLSHDLLHAAGVVNLVGMVATIWQLLRLRAHVLWPVAAAILPTLLLGVLLGVTALRTLDRHLMVQALGVTTVGIAAWNLWRPRLQRRESRGVNAVVGLLAGVLGGAFNTGGPPLIAHLYRRSESPDAIRGTVQALFLAISTSRALTSAAQGLFDAAIVETAVIAVPAMGVGLLAGFALSRRIGPDRFRRASWVALGVLGTVLILRG